MKKFLLSLAAMALGMSAMAVETSYTIEFKADLNSNNLGTTISAETAIADIVESGAASLSGVAADPTPDQAYAACNYGLKIGANKKAGVVAFDIATGFQVVPTKIEIQYSASKNASYQKLTFNDQKCPDLTDQVNGTYATATFTDFTEALKTIKFNKTNASTTSSQQGFIFVKSIKVYYEATGDTKIPTVSFPQDAYNVVFGSAFSAPTATTDSDGAVTYASSDETVATVDAATGVVTILAVGTTTITANVAATDTYFAGSAVYTLHVTDPNVILDSPMGADFTFENVEGQSYPWSHDNKYGLKGSAYINNKVVACEGYAISPVIDLNNKVEVTLNFQRAFNQYKVNNQNIDLADFSGYAYVVAREENATEWTVVSELKPTEAFSWTYYDNAPISLDAFKGKKVQFAFKYVSTAECAGTWEVKNIRLSGLTTDAVNEIESVSDAAPVYYNLQGQRVANPERGIYIRVQGNKSSKVMF